MVTNIILSIFYTRFFFQFLHSYFQCTKTIYFTWKRKNGDLKTRNVCRDTEIAIEVMIGLIARFITCQVKAANGKLWKQFEKDTDDYDEKEF